MPTAIASVSEIKVFAAIQTDNQDSVIASLISPCLQAIGNFCNRNFQSHIITEYRDGNDGVGIMLANYPITTLSGLTVDDVAIPKSVNGLPGYIAYSGGRRVTLKGYRFTRGSRNVAMTLTAGYGDGSMPDGSDIMPWPDDLKLALMMFVAVRLKERTRLGVGTQAMAGQTVTYTDATSGTSGSSQGIPSAARIILENYMNTVPESGQ